MEVDVDANGTGTVIASGKTYTVGEKTYRVTYSMNTSTGTATGSTTDPTTGTATGSTTEPATGTATGSTTDPTTGTATGSTTGSATDPGTGTETGIVLAGLATTAGKQPTANMTVTNTYLEKLNLKITKEGKNTTDGSLSGVEFKLEKKDKTGEWFEQVGSPKTTNVDGIATFENLGQGTYRLTETKAAAGYNLLSDSILIEIRASNDVWWKMEKKTEKETEGGWTQIRLQGEKEIPLTIYNTKQLILPATGGSGFGLVTMGGIALMAQAILMGTYFTLQCRKGDDKLRKKR